MKILQFGKFYPPDIGGIEVVMQDITESLNARNIKCDVLCANSALKNSEEILECGAKITRCASFGKLSSTAISPSMIFKIRKMIKSYDIIHLHLPDPMANLAFLASDYKDKKIVLHWHSDIIRQKNLLKFYAPLQTKLLNLSHAIIATSEKYISQSAFLAPYKNKCVCIPIGLDESKFAISRGVKPFAKFGENKKVIFSLGRFTQKKGLEYLVLSAKDLSDEYVICIGGSGDIKVQENLENIISREKLENKVFLLGRISREDLFDYYKNSHIFVLPSLQESYGLVLVEAMCASVPMISTNLKPSGVNWVNQDKITGIVVEAQDSKAIASAIKKIDENYSFFSTNARNRYLAHFTQDKMIDKIINLYDNLMKKGRI